MSTLTFEDLDLSPELLSGLRDLNYDEPTDLQKKLIPLILEGKDLVINSSGGKGLQAAVLVPALEKILRSDGTEGSRIMILTPFHDDARDIDERVWAMGYHGQIECAPIGMEGEREEQEKAIANGVQVLAANPGRLIEILEDTRSIFRHIDILIIDRADQIVSLNLQHKIKDIKKRVISDHQTLFITPELNNEISEFAKSILNEPETFGFGDKGSNGVSLNSPPTIPDKLKQGYILVPNRMKITTLVSHLDNSKDDNCVIFTASKRGTDRLYRVLRKGGKKATSLHGKLSDEKRSQRFSNFVNGDVQYLLVADISAAELDLNNVKQVINYDVPNDVDEYRFRANLVSHGKASRIVSLVSKQDRDDISQLKNELGQAPQELPLPDKVKQQLKKRKKNNKQKRNRSKKKKKRPARGNRDKKGKMELPRPSYDKLSGGRSGKKEEEEKGIVGFFKKLFS